MDTVYIEALSSAFFVQKSCGESSPGRVPLIVVVGPTAVGKTTFAMALAKALQGEIISADSMQVYRFLDIGTDKPSWEARREIPYHLIDVVDPTDPFTAKDYERLGLAALVQIWGRGRIPIVVGGTGLYVRALLKGIFPGPSGDQTLRTALYKEAEERGPSHLYRRLQEVDPEAASRIHPNDLFRIIRALEVYFVTGRPISEHHREGHRPPLKPLVYLGLRRERAELYRLINERVDRMMAAGFLCEVEGLLRRGYKADLKPMQGLGYRHLLGYLQGCYSLDTAIDLFKRDTRRYAKRQMTWFSKEEGVEWVDIEGSEWVPDLVRSVKKSVEKVLGKH